MGKPDFPPASFTPTMLGYTGQGAFRYWCQTALPLVYDDSLSYYELLNKVVNYLNNVISDVSSTETNVESLLTAYNQLQDYVNTYFNGVDIQDEINKKLDELASDGTLSDLINPFIPDLVTGWLNEHVTPTSPAVDNTLTISGAAADAKVTGDNISNLNNDFNYLYNLSTAPVWGDLAISATRSFRKDISIPAGTYRITCDNVSSSDTDANTSNIYFYYVNSTSDNLQVACDRNVKIDEYITLERDVRMIYFFASTNNALSQNDTFTFTNFFIGKPLTDKTLTKNYIPADAKAVGDIINENTNDVEQILSSGFDDTIPFNSYSPSWYNPSSGIYENTLKWVSTDKIKLPYEITLLRSETNRWQIVTFNGNTVETTITNIPYVTIHANKDFILSIGYANQDNITNVADLLKNTHCIKTGHKIILNVSERIAQILDTHKNGGTFNPILEMGNVSNDGVLSNARNRMSSLHGFMIPFNKGDIITCNDSNYQFFIRGKLYDGTNVSSGSWRSTYEITEKMRGFILVQEINTANFTIDQIKTIEQKIVVTVKQEHVDIIKYGAYINGEYAETHTRICNTDLLHNTLPIKVTPSSGYRIDITYYDENGVYERNEGTQVPYIIPQNSYYRWYLRSTDNRTFYSEDINNVYEYVNFDENPDQYINTNWCTISLFPTIGVLGDSFASGSIHHYPDDTGWTDGRNVSWPQIMGRRTGCDVTNFTKGGLSVKTWLSDNEYGLNAMLADSPKDLYIINFGINDHTQINNGTLTLGTIADCHEDYTTNPDTFYGDYGRIIGNIMTHAPGCKIVILSVARRYERETMDTRIEEIATHFNLPYIYLPDDDFFISEFYYDSIVGNHPLAYAYSGMATAIERLIVNYITQYPEYFKTYYGTPGTAN